MRDPELDSYCERIEDFFFQLKGRPGTLSPADFARVRRWFDQAIPLQAVVEGIEAAFQSHGAGRNAAAEEVNGLVFCEPFIEQASRRVKGVRF